MIKFNLPVTARLSLLKSVLALSLLATIACTWPLWTANRYYPLYPGTGLLSSVHLLVTYILPALLVLCLVLLFLVRRPRFFIFLSLTLGISLLLLDTARGQYWFCFYMLVLLILFGYNWRVDNINHYSSFFNALKITLALVYLFAAVQHFQSSFFTASWPAFVKPFERFFTPEQCSYLVKTGYAVPFLELFICAALFIPGAKIAAISLAIVFHLFSVLVLALQPQAEPAVIVWHISLCLQLIVVFGGRISQQKSYTYSISFYPATVIMLFGLILPVYFFVGGKTLQNKIDLMQHNPGNQFVYVDETAKDKLPLYLQSFALQREDGYCKLNLTAWVLHETHTRQVLAPLHLTNLTAQLNAKYGVEGLVFLPPAREPIALK